MNDVRGWGVGALRTRSRIFRRFFVKERGTSAERRGRGIDLEYGVCPGRREVNDFYGCLYGEESERRAWRRSRILAGEPDVLGRRTTTITRGIMPRLENSENVSMTSCHKLPACAGVHLYGLMVVLTAEEYSMVETCERFI